MMRPKCLSLFILLLLFQTSLAQSYSLKELMGIEYCSKCLKENNFLHSEALKAFIKMQQEALKSGIKIQIVSGNRNFNRQKYIFNKKYNRYKNQGLSELQILNKIIEYSTIPGTSRHHWGTDIDIIQKVENLPKTLLNSKNYSNNGSFCELKEWMDKNSEKFGFFLAYTENPNRKGFKYEPWHYSYAPISKKLLEDFKKLYYKGEVLKTITQHINLNGSFFEEYMKNNILGINSLLKI